MQQSARHHQRSFFSADYTNEIQETSISSSLNLLSTAIPDATISLIDPSPPKSCTPYTPPQSNLSPVEAFRRARLAHHPHSIETNENDKPQVARLLRTAYPHNLFRDPDPSSTPGRKTHVALALPVTRSQRECCKHHEKLFVSYQGSAPVECGVCACAGDCDEDEDGDVFYMCEYCALRMCCECEKYCREHGMAALNARSKDHFETHDPEWTA